MLTVHQNMLNRIIYTFVVLSLFCTSIAAQKQVTLDRTKLAYDRNKKEKAMKQAVESKKQATAQVAKRKTTRRKKVVEQTEFATYLRVNGMYGEVTKEVSNTSEYITFNVFTDGIRWDISLLPAWCTVSSRTANSFTLHIEGNTSYDQRKDWLYVKSDNKQVKVNIIQDARPINVYASINNAWITHNCVVNGKDCMVVYGSFDITNGNGLKFYAVAMIQNEYGNYINASTSYPEYKMSDGKFYAAAETSSLSGNTHNFRIDIPNNSFYPGYEKKHQLRLVVTLYCEKKRDYIPGVSRTIPFVAKKKKKGIQTKEK